jgi:hypothetical protein
MKQPTQHTITNSNPTQVCHPPPAVRRGIAIVAFAAIVLVPTALLANRIVGKSEVTAQAGVAEETAAAAVAHEVTFAAAPVTVPPVPQAIAASCGLICDPDMGALWQQVVSASDSDARTTVVAEAIRSMLRTIDDAVAAAASALP